MKKAISTLALVVGLAAGASAQARYGDIAPNFTLKDIDGNNHNLYSYLDSGYTVILDVSAAWCAPCWAVHKSRVFENLTDHYGRTGTIAAGKIKIIFIEGESTNTIAQIRGTTTAQTYAGLSQGDWTAGTNYPIIDDASQNGNYLYGGFPSFTVICRDRLVKFQTSGYSAPMLTEKFWLDLANGNCPTYAPSKTLDVKAIPYNGNEAFECNAAPTISFQNYSETQNLTSATVNVYAGTTKIATQNWTGNIPPYGIGSVSIPSFAGTTLGGYRYEVTTSGDSYIANDKSSDSLFKVYAAGNALPGSWSENFQSQTTDDFSYRMTSDAGQMRLFTTATSSTTTYTAIGTDGKPTRALIVGFPEADALNQQFEVILGNFNTSGNTNVTLGFDLAYSLGTITTASDKLEIMTSKDCGATWKSMWSKSGADLATTTHATGPFIPSKAADWRQQTVVLSTEKDANMMIKVRGTVASSASGVGHYAFMDNFRLTNTLGVNNVIASSDVKLFPNPAKEAATLVFSLVKSNTVTVSVIDALGRTVSTIANGTMAQGEQRVSIPTASLAAGVYTVNIQTEEGNLTQRLSVVK